MSVSAGQKNNVRLSDYFPKAIFWDVDLDGWDVEEDADFIIPRVLDWGWVGNAWDQLNKLYNKNSIIFHCKNSPEIRGNEKIEKLASLYRLKPEDFKGYIHGLNVIC